MENHLDIQNSCNKNVGYVVCRTKTPITYNGTEFSTLVNTRLMGFKEPMNMGKSEHFFSVNLPLFTYLSV